MSRSVLSNKIRISLVGSRCRCRLRCRDVSSRFRRGYPAARASLPLWLTAPRHRSRYLPKADKILLWNLFDSSRLGRSLSVSPLRRPRLSAVAFPREPLLIGPRTQPDLTATAIRPPPIAPPRMRAAASTAQAYGLAVGLQIGSLLRTITESSAPIAPLEGCQDYPKRAMPEYTYPIISPTPRA